MQILAVDTSSLSGSVALLEDDRVVAEWILHSAQTHNRRLIRTIDSLLREAGWSLQTVDGFAVTMGPGSFTGIRIGLSTMKTLAWSLEKPFVGIPSLDALAAPFDFAELPVLPLIDARKKELYYAAYCPDGMGRQCRRGDFMVDSPAAIAEAIDEPTILCGDGWLVYRNLFRGRLGNLAIAAPSPCHTIRASFVGELARRRILADDIDDALTGTPLYVRPSEAEIKHPNLSPFKDRDV